jgi:predicted Rossmann-fold nucleotide-binding protein
MIVYTGFGYAGRNLILTRAADAVVVGCGRIGTVNEFTHAFEDKKPIGVLVGAWDTDELLKFVLEDSHRAKEMEGKIIFESDPRILVEKLVEIVKKEKMTGGPVDVK